MNARSLLWVESYSLVVIAVSLASALLAVVRGDNELFNSIFGNLAAQGLFSSLVLARVVRSNKGAKWAYIAYLASAVNSLICFLNRLSPISLSALSKYYVVLAVTLLGIMASAYYWVRKEHLNAP